MPISAKQFRKKLKDSGIFYTDPKLAEKMKAMLPDDITEVYDPTCGDGALLSVFDDSVQKYGQDVLEDQVEYAREHLVNFHGVVGDTLTDPAFMGHKFRAIIANPPFSISWDPVENDIRFKGAPAVPTRSKADYAFLMHIMYYLAEDGTAVALNSPGVLFRGQREGKLREWFVRQNWIDKVIHVPGGYFVDTAIPTVLLVLKKHRDTTDIEFADWEHDMSRTVTFDEIANAKFNLSVNNFLSPPVQKANVDPFELDREVRKSMTETLRKGLEMSWTLEQFQPGCFVPLLEGLESVLKEYREKVDSSAGQDCVDRIREKVSLH